MQKDRKQYVVWKRVVALVASVLIVLLLGFGFYPVPPLAKLLDPSKGVWKNARQAEHPQEQSITLEGLRDKVTVIRDKRGVPHIFAQNAKDLCYAFGYVQAQDRLWQMDIGQRDASGRSAEVFGKFALRDNFRKHELGLVAAAERNCAALEGSPLYAELEAYVSGINAYMASLNPSELPLEFKLFNYAPEPWTVEHCFCQIKSLTWQLSSGSYYPYEKQKTETEMREILGDSLYNRFYPEYPAYSPPVIPEKKGMPPQDRTVYSKTNPHPGLGQVSDTDEGPVNLVTDADKVVSFVDNNAETGRQHVMVYADGLESQSSPYIRGIGSNNWVISPDKSASGKAILAHDPHVWLTLPSMWYEAHLVCPEYDVYGIALLNTPYIIYGFNRYMAWGSTTFNADVRDCYMLQLDESGEKYLYDGAWLPIEKDTVLVKVRNGKDSLCVFENSVHGPVMDWKKGKFAFRWVGHEVSNEMNAFRNINRAQTNHEFEQALDDYFVSPHYIAYADVYGNIGMYASAKVPVRNNSDGRYPLDGSSAETNWSKFIPFEQMPHSVNPEQGFLVSANQYPVREGYPYYLGDGWEEGFRARRITQLLQSKEKISFADMQRIQCDIVDARVQNLLPIMLTAIENKGMDDPILREIYDVFKNWDGRFTPESSAAVIFNHVLNFSLPIENKFRSKYNRSFIHLRNEIRECIFLNEAGPEWFDLPQTDELETRDDYIISKLKSVYDYSVKRYGVELKNMRRGNEKSAFYIDHLTDLPGLGYPRLPLKGSRYTISYASRNVGPLWRMVVEPGDEGRKVGVYPGGQSGNPASKHYDDNIAPWYNQKYFELLYPKTAEALEEKNIESVLTLNPGGRKNAK